MDGETFTDHWTRQDHATATALRQVHTRLDASTCAAYLTADGGRTLNAAMIIDAPLSFANPTSFATDNSTWATVRAFHAEEALAFSADELEKNRDGHLQFVASLAIPYLVSISLAASPIRTSQHRYGVIAVRWTPARPVSPTDLAFLQQAADGLAVAFESLESDEEAVKPPIVPLFVPERPELPGDPDADQSLFAEATKMAADRSSYLHQLQRLASALVRAVRVEDILAVAQDRVVRPFHGTGFAACLSERDRLHVVGAAGLPRETVRGLEGTPLASRSPQTDAMKRNRAVVFPSTARLTEEYPDVHLEPQQHAIGYFPIVRSGTSMGCCVVEFAESGRFLSPAEATLLTLMLDHVGQAFGRARSTEVEHALTRSIQRSLLPRSFPHIPEMVATARYFSATAGIDVGGDWYDVLTLPDNRIGLVIGDVEGHSLEAAAVMGQLRSGVRAFASEGHEPAAVLERSNQLLLGLDTDLYATCCCMWLDVVTGLATIASAGHPRPLISQGPRQVTRPDLPAEPPLGTGRRATYQQRTFELQPGSITALFTDGLLESQRTADKVALNRLGRALADRSEGDLEVLADRIIDDSLADQGLDDAALVLLHYEGVQPRDTADVARMRLPRGDLGGVADVRSFLRDRLRMWDLPFLVDDAQISACEVVTNALIHARSAVDLRLRRYANRVRLEVQDSDPNPPVPTALLEDEAGNEEAESGRGLLIVDALADKWGSSPAGRGKITWFELSASDDAE